MYWNRELRFATKLALSFATLLILTVILGIFSIFQMEKLNEASTKITTGWTPAMRAVLETKTGLALYRSQTLEHILSAEDAEKVKLEEKMTATSAAFQANKDAYAKLAVTPEQKQALDEFVNLLPAYLDVNTQILTLSHENRSIEAVIMLAGPLRVQYDLIDAQIDKLVRINSEGGLAAAQLSDQSYRSSRIAIMAVLMGSLVIGIGAAVFITRMLMKQLGGEPGYAVVVAERIAGGDLTLEVETKAGDNASLLFAIKMMREKLAGIVTEVRNGTDAIASASNEVASGNLDLSTRTEQQAGSLEETAAAMEQLTGTIKQNAGNVLAADGLARSASDIADEGGRIVARVVETMNAINVSSAKISDIISVIDGIAFQTNILSLNAAVEAARAGEQGRGFAVVASEVRSLAQRSAAAAKEIKALIGDSVEKVTSGATLVDEAGITMAQIVSSIKNVTEVMREVAGATHEQSIGVEQINRAIAEMDEVTQQNAALVEESAAASQLMQEQALKLAATVGAFRLNHTPVQDINPVPGKSTAAVRANPPSKIARAETVARLARPPVAKAAARHSARLESF